MITLLTCTGGRPEAFHLLESWMARRNFDYPLQWIVVDDHPVPTECHLGQQHIRVEPYWEPGKITLCRNVMTGLDAVRYDKLLFIEDDEAYLPDYVENMWRLLETTHLAGQTPARYFNVATRRYKELPNATHASLCQTGVRREMFPRIRELCMQKSPFFDIPLWAGSRGKLVAGEDVVSIKGLPGRPGIGIGHRASHAWLPDPQLRQLSKWLGGAKLAGMYSRFETLRPRELAAAGPI